MVRKEADLQPAGSPADTSLSLARWQRGEPALLASFNILWRLAQAPHLPDTQDGCVEMTAVAHPVPVSPIVLEMQARSPGFG